LLPKSSIARKPGDIAQGASGETAGNGILVAAIAEAARIAVLMLRRAMRSSRDHFIAAATPAYRLINKGPCCGAAKP
jgi:hypothetical protein